ncbi:MAG: hypothetical protein ACREYF_12060 [Gammaproteobacteria bacterium]
MTNIEILHRLEELFRAKEVEVGFPSQRACLSWTNKVAPLLRFDARYYDAFTHGLQIISTNVSSYTTEPTFRAMLSQVEIAIEQLKLDTGTNSESTALMVEAAAKPASIFKFEPNFHGIGLNLNEAFRRFKNWRNRRKQ